MMCRQSLADLPDPRPPDGYTIRSYEEGDAGSWDRVICDAFEYEPTDGDRFERMMKNDVAFCSERIFFLCRHHQPVATASAWPEPAFGPQTGTLHYVGVIKREASCGLGCQISLAALQQMKREGRTRAMLRTDDHRIPAIKLYLKLGFIPFLVHENQRRRWRDVLDLIQRPELIRTFQSHLAAEICRP